MRKRLPHLNVKSVLDYGAATGRGLWAARDVWPKLLEKYHCIEPSADFARMSRHFTTGVGCQVSYRPRLWDKDVEKQPLVVAAYSLSKIRPTRRRF